VRRIITGALLAGALLIPVVPAQAQVTGGAGWRGSSYLPQADCKYSNNGLRGWLTASVSGPSVTGTNTSRRRHYERSWARYAVWLVGVYSGSTYAVSNWSSWLRVRERSWRSWNGITALSADWAGDYRLEVRFEWWRNGRRIGWRSHRITSYRYFDQYNVGPYGPLSWCMAYR
jgi:hypothetical protein